MRYLVVALFVVHGLLHLLGLQSGRMVGAVWGVASLSLLVTALLLLIRRDSWWMVGGAGLVLSQFLIVSAWSTARAGTAVNVLLLIPLVIGAAQARFQHQSDASVRRLLLHVPAVPPTVVTDVEIAGLPAPVRRWLTTSGVVGRERTQVVRLQQRASMRTAPDQAWMAARASQYFTVDAPGFVWTVSASLKGLPIVGRDTYQDGRGRMLIKAAGLVSVADGTGPTFDQGTLVRYLGESVFFPSAALAPYVRWDPVDDSSARAIMTYAGVSASALFTFDDSGRFLRLTAERYMSAGKSASFERWEVEAHAWKQMNGVLIPLEGTVTWKLKGGDFEYYRWAVTAIEFNRAALDGSPAAHSQDPRDARAQLPVKDPINVAGMRACHVLTGDMPLADWAQLGRGPALVLDVREPAELSAGSEAGPVTGALNIPLSSLRQTPRRGPARP